MYNWKNDDKVITKIPKYQKQSGNHRVISKETNPIDVSIAIITKKTARVVGCAAVMCISSVTDFLSGGIVKTL